MRKALLSALAAASLTPGLALAQEGAPTPVEKEAPPPPTQRGEVGVPGAAHKVERGDTLWDLSQKYLGSPWYWPKVWSFNPEIANPHWIYPGNDVRFFPSGEEVPAQVDVGPAVEDVEESAPIEDTEGVVTHGPLAYTPKGTITLTGTGFVTTREIEETGRVAGSFAESSMLSFPQTFYAEFTNKRAVRLGETFVIFRSDGEVIHPISKSPIGYMTRIVGQAKVVRVERTGVATCVIERQFDEVLRGDLLGPAGESLTKTVSPRPNDKDIDGAVIVTSMPMYLTNFGEHHLVVIDRGSDDGVKAGNVFTVIRQNDFVHQAMIFAPMLVEEKWPVEDVGHCMAFEVKSKATTCIMIQSMREIVIGDRVVMRSGRSRTAMR